MQLNENKRFKNRAQMAHFQSWPKDFPGLLTSVFLFPL